MAGDVVNIKVCSPLKMRGDLTGKKPASATTHTIYRCNALEKTVTHILNMKRRNLIVLIGTAVVLLQSCIFSGTKLREIKFKPEMQDVTEKYKKQLEPEIFRISPAWFRFDTVTAHKVIVTIYNSEKLPEDFNEKKNLALKIASDVYPQIENKEDYSKIEILFQNQSGSVVKIKTKSNYPFSYEEIEEYLENR